MGAIESLIVMIAIDVVRSNGRARRLARILMAVVLAPASALAVLASGSGCQTDLQCSLNGVCLQVKRSLAGHIYAGSVATRLYIALASCIGLLRLRQAMGW